MRQRPGADELLDLARRTLRDDESPGTSYTARMAASAQAIANREIETADADAKAERVLFEAFYGARQVADVSLADLNRRLALEIRDGKWDAGDGELEELLLEQTRARLRRNNPKYLKARENAP